MMQQVSRPRPGFTEEHVLFTMVFIVTAGLVCITPAQNDTWWHLRSGREMWESGSFLLTERFSHTAYGAQLHNHWWLSQLAFFGAYSLGGAPLLTLFAGACAIAAVFGSWRLIRGPFELRLGMLMFLVVATAPEWAIRPQVISLALLVLLAHLIHRDRVWWLPIVCVIWANAHALVLFGVVMAGAVAAEALFWSREKLRRDAAIAALCVAAPMLSPLGWAYWPRVLATVGMSQALNLQEYRAPFELRDLPFWMAALSFAGLAIANWRSVRQWPRSVRILAIASCILGVAAVSAARNIAFFAVIAAPVIAYLAGFRDAVPQRQGLPVRWPAFVTIATIFVATIVVVGLRWQGGGLRLGWQPISEVAVERLRACPGATFNHLEDGGYLMWAAPERPVFVDSRMEAYPLELLRRSQAADLRGDYTTLFSDYDISCAIVRTGSVLGQRLALDSAMDLVHTDARHTVFVTTSGAGSVSADGVDRHGNGRTAIGW